MRRPFRVLDATITTCVHCPYHSWTRQFVNIHSSMRGSHCDLARKILTTDEAYNGPPLWCPLPEEAKQ